MENTELSLKDMRAALQALGQGGKEIAYQLVYEMLGAECEEQRGIVRSLVSTMARHGEIRRTGRGKFIYDFNRKPTGGTAYHKIWRFVRAAKPGWSIQDCSLMTRVSYTQVIRYVNWLCEAGYVERAGRNERNGVIYRNTALAQASPETPYPPIKDSDPFAKERAAAATITRLMLCANPYAVSTARQITAACQTLMARFDKENFTELENPRKGDAASVSQTSWQRLRSREENDVE